MSTDLRVELHSFCQAVADAAQSDTFNVAKMTEKTPEGIKAWAEENEIDFVELLNRWANRAAESEAKLSDESPHWSEM